MVVNQIYALVDDISKEMYGMKAASVKDTSSFITFGNQVLSSATDVDKFYGILNDRISRVIIAIRAKSEKKRSVRREGIEWGAAINKISYKRVTPVENPTWVTESQASPYDIAPQTEAVSNIFKFNLGTYSYEDSIPNHQLFSAFLNESGMAAFVSGIYIRRENDFKAASEALDNLAVATNIAGVFAKGKPAQLRNLLKEYNDANGTTLTSTSCFRDPDWLTFASQEINEIPGYMESPESTAYNISADIPRHTPKDKCVVEVLTKFANAVRFNLRSNVYHETLVQLPRYESVDFWQTPGDRSIAEASKISIKNDLFKTELNATGEITKAGIIAFIHDYDSVASVIDRERSGSIYNDRAERTNIWKKAELAYMLDLTENAVVFYVADEE